MDFRHTLKWKSCYSLVFHAIQLISYFIISDTEDNLQQAVSLLHRISKEYNLEIDTKKTKVFGFVGTDHIRIKIIINDETLEQVSQFTYLGCSISYQFSNDANFFFLWRCDPTRVMASSFLRFSRSHTTTHHSR